MCLLERNRAYASGGDVTQPAVASDCSPCPPVAVGPSGRSIPVGFATDLVWGIALLASSPTRYQQPGEGKGANQKRREPSWSSRARVLD